MNLIITENQLNDVINILLEDNYYYDYNNASDDQKQAFYRHKNGYSIANKPMPDNKSKSVMIYKWKGGDINQSSSWDKYKPFQSWALAQSWINKNVYPQNKKYYKIVQI